MRSRGTAARARAALTTVAVIAVLAACTGEEPGPGPTASEGPVSVSPSPEPTPSETPAPETVPPERPDAMADDGVAGAEATARYFLELYPYVYATGDLTEWNALSHEDCMFCASVVDRVSERARDGKTTRGGAITFLELSSESTASGLEHVTGTVTQDALEIVDSEGRIVQEEPLTQYRISVVVGRDAGQSVVHGVSVEAVA